MHSDFGLFVLSLHSPNSTLQATRREVKYPGQACGWKRKRNIVSLMNNIGFYRRSCITGILEKYASVLFAFWENSAYFSFFQQKLTISHEFKRRYCYWQFYPFEISHKTSRSGIWWDFVFTFQNNKFKLGTTILSVVGSNTKKIILTKYMGTKCVKIWKQLKKGCCLNKHLTIMFSIDTWNVCQ